MNIRKWIVPLLIGSLLLFQSACSVLAPAGSTDKQPGDGQAGTKADPGKEGGDGEAWGLDLSTPDESVNYGIYVGANIAGTCDPYTNSGGFKYMTFDSAFHQIVFVRPGSQKALTQFGGMYKADGGAKIPVAGIGLLGEGEVGDFTFCPQYNGDEECACHVTNGPNPFEPVLALLPQEDLPLVPLVGTPEPNNLGYALLHYSMGGTKELGPIMEWAGCVGSGALGGSLEPVDVYFQISWDKLMAGEEFADSVTTGDEGEKWEWSIRFVPGY